VRVRFLVAGLVQGVGFRAFVRRRALQLGLRGYTRNLHDGRVEAMVEGEEPAVRAFESELWKGPSMASVRDVIRAEISDAMELPKGFEIG